MNQFEENSWEEKDQQKSWKCLILLAFIIEASNFVFAIFGYILHKKYENNKMKVEIWIGFWMFLVVSNLFLVYKEIEE